jgi:hypothetical protein
MSEVQSMDLYEERKNEIEEPPLIPLGLNGRKSIRK